MEQQISDLQNRINLLEANSINFSVASEMLTQLETNLLTLNRRSVFTGTTSPVNNTNLYKLGDIYFKFNTLPTPGVVNFYVNTGTVWFQII